MSSQVSTDPYGNKIIANIVPYGTTENSFFVEKLRTAIAYLDDTYPDKLATCIVRRANKRVCRELESSGFQKQVSWLGKHGAVLVLYKRAPKNKG